MHGRTRSIRCIERITKFNLQQVVRLCIYLVGILIAAFGGSFLLRMLKKQSERGQGVPFECYQYMGPEGFRNPEHWLGSNRKRWDAVLNGALRSDIPRRQITSTPHLAPFLYCQGNERSELTYSKGQDNGWLTGGQSICISEIVV